MESLDCPSGDQITPARGNSVTVQQALALWNDAFMASHCQHIADHVRSLITEQSQGSVPADRDRQEIELAVRLILNRPLVDKERQDFVDYTSRHGLANLCRLLLNSNEFLFVN
jgi:hypothetical protein